LAGEGDQTAAESAVIRTELLHPWPGIEIDALLSRYPRAEEVVWLQEEPENMGAWSYVRGTLGEQLRGGPELWHVSRAPSGSPATGSAALSQLESEDLLQRAFGKH
jgi:multifunctional 2-oxoglutarate metabolism enzyme